MTWLLLWGHLEAKTLDSCLRRNDELRVRANQVYVYDDFSMLSPEEKINAAFDVVSKTCAPFQCAVPSKYSIKHPVFFFGNDAGTTIGGGYISFSSKILEWSGDPFGPVSTLILTYHETMHRADTPQIRSASRSELSPRHIEIYNLSHDMGVAHIGVYVDALRKIASSKMRHD